MIEEQQKIIKLIEDLNNGIKAGTITTEEEEKLRDDISDLQMNYIIGTLDD